MAEHTYLLSIQPPPFPPVQWKGDGRKSNAPWPLERRNGTFMMSPRLFPGMDGLGWNTNWLIHRLAECAAAVSLLSCSFPPGQNIEPDMPERMTNEWDRCKHCSCLSREVLLRSTCLSGLKCIYIEQARATYSAGVRMSIHEGYSCFLVGIFAVTWRWQTAPCFTET